MKEKEQLKRCLADLEAADSNEPLKEARKAAFETLIAVVGSHGAIRFEPPKHWAEKILNAGDDTRDEVKADALAAESERVFYRKPGGREEGRPSDALITAILPGNHDCVPDVECEDLWDGGRVTLSLADIDDPAPVLAFAARFI